MEDSKRQNAIEIFKNAKIINDNYIKIVNFDLTYSEIENTQTFDANLAESLKKYDTVVCLNFTDRNQKIFCRLSYVESDKYYYVGNQYSVIGESVRNILIIFDMQNKTYRNYETDANQCHIATTDYF